LFSLSKLRRALVIVELNGGKYNDIRCKTFNNSPQEVSYGIGLILQAVTNNHSSKVTVNIHVDRNYEIQK